MTIGRPKISATVEELVRSIAYMKPIELGVDPVNAAPAGNTMAALQAQGALPAVGNPRDDRGSGAEAEGGVRERQTDRP